MSASMSTTSGSQPTCHLCVMGVGERDDDALREVSLSFGDLSSIERNAKVTAEQGGVVHETVSIDPSIVDTSASMYHTCTFKTEHIK